MRKLNCTNSLFFISNLYTSNVYDIIKKNTKNLLPELKYSRLPNNLEDLIEVFNWIFYYDYDLNITGVSSNNSIFSEELFTPIAKYIKEGSWIEVVSDNFKFRLVFKDKELFIARPKTVWVVNKKNKQQSENFIKLNKKWT